MTDDKVIKSILERFAGQKILVFGDLMLDRYVHGSVDRISPEAPVPVIRVTGRKSLPGGAANVALNIRSLGGEVVVAGLAGDDEAGRELRELLIERGIGANAVVSGADRKTTVKTRILAERQQVARVDVEDSSEPSAELIETLGSAAADALTGATGVVIEDYGKGAVCNAAVCRLLDAARSAHIPVAFDPKDNHELAVSGIAVVTPNYREACLAAGLPERPLCSGSGGTLDPADNPVLREAGTRLMNKWQPEMLLITLGAHGMYVVKRDGERAVIPARAREVFDVCGAGDTVVAVCLLAVAAGALSEQAAAIANAAAGVVVGKIGAATCSRRELIEAMAVPES